MPEIRIALTGKMRTGKDTVYKLIEQQIKQYKPNKYKHKITKVAFGDALKKYSEALFPEKYHGGKPRELLQSFGQLARQIDEDVWVNQVRNKVGEASSLKDWDISYHSSFYKGNHPMPSQYLVVTIITDVRQPNEYQYCKDNGFHIIKVTAPDDIRIARMQSDGDTYSEENLQHETETHIDSFVPDDVINNYHVGMDKLGFNVELILKDLLNKLDEVN